ncbi:hypothetical protein [Methylomonas koyamae]|nr:hypothetical protein [Methylomonas koyamae]WNB76102.1 hypothetical protein RI210_00655 [Methylomonas koyamae]
MMRMLLEVLMVLALVGGLFFATKVLAKEKRDSGKPGGDSSADTDGG